MRSDNLGGIREAAKLIQEDRASVNASRGKKELPYNPAGLAPRRRGGGVATCGSRSLVASTLSLAIGWLIVTTQSVLAGPVVNHFDRYWTGSAVPLPFTSVVAADYDAASQTVWAADISGQIARLSTAGRTCEIVAGLPASPRNIYYDRQLGRVVATWGESVAVVNPNDGGYHIFEMPTFGGSDDWYDYSSHTLFMTFWSHQNGLKSYSVSGGTMNSRTTPATGKITGSDSYLMVHDADGVTLYDHALNTLRDFTAEVFPHFNTWPGNPHFLSMTSDDVFAYGDLNDTSNHQYYIGGLDPDEILYDISDATYPLSGIPGQMQNCYYSEQENVLYVTESAMATEGLLQIDLDSHQVVRFGGPEYGYAEDVMRRGDRMVFYGTDGVFVSNPVPEPGVLCLLALGGLAAIRRRT